MSGHYPDGCSPADFDRAHAGFSGEPCPSCYTPMRGGVCDECQAAAEREEGESQATAERGAEIEIEIEITDLPGFLFTQGDTDTWYPGYYTRTAFQPAAFARADTGILFEYAR